MINQLLGDNYWNELDELVRDERVNKRVVGFNALMNFIETHNIIVLNSAPNKSVASTFTYVDLKNIDYQALHVELSYQVSFKFQSYLEKSNKTGFTALNPKAVSYRTQFGKELMRTKNLQNLYLMKKKIDSFSLSNKITLKDFKLMVEDLIGQDLL